MAHYNIVFLLTYLIFYSLKCWAYDQSTGNLSQNPQEAVIATYICFLTNFTELELTNTQVNYWRRQMHCGASNQNYGWATADPAHAAAPPCIRCTTAATQHGNEEVTNRWTLTSIGVTSRLANAYTGPTLYTLPSVLPALCNNTQCIYATIQHQLVEQQTMFPVTLRN